MSQKQQIINLLSDFQVHCTAHEMYMKDDRSRISELRKAGYIFDETLGTCKDLSHNHGADLKLRRLISEPMQNDAKPMQNNTKLLPMTKKIAEWNLTFYPKKEEVKETNNQGLW